MARTKGAKNIIGATAKENVINVFSRIGGVKSMVKWANENPNDFYKLYARLIPQQVDLEVTERPVDVSANPLQPDEWDSLYGAGSRAN